MDIKFAFELIAIILTIAVTRFVFDIKMEHRLTIVEQSLKELRADIESLIKDIERKV